MCDFCYYQTYRFNIASYSSQDWRRLTYFDESCCQVEDASAILLEYTEPQTNQPTVIDDETIKNILNNIMQPDLTANQRAKAVSTSSNVLTTKH